MNINQPFYDQAALKHIKIKKMDSPSWLLEATFIASSLCKRRGFQYMRQKKYKFTLKRRAQMYIDAGVI